jgi:polar amino acid transport system permease protein
MAMRYIVIPQALRVIIPPTGNEYISMLKTTSLLFAIAVPEVFATGSSFYSSDFRYFEVLTVVSIWYLLLTSVLTAVQRRLERRFGEGRMNVGRVNEGVFGRLLRVGMPSAERR